MSGEKEAPRSAEESADWQRLQDMAAGGAVPAEESPPQDPAEAWAVAPAVLGAILGMALPEVRQVYTREACLEWGRAMVPVAEKYGWDADLFGPELALAAVSVPMLAGTGIAIMKHRVARHHRAEPEQEQRPEADDAPSPPRGSIVIGGADANG